MNAFAQIVQRWQDQPGHSLRQLALESGVDRTKISAYMRGDVEGRILTPEQTHAIARALGVPERSIDTAVLTVRGYDLQTPTYPARVDVLAGLLSTFSDEQLAAVEATALAVR